MSVAFDEPDWDASTETRYEEYRASLADGLCDRCGENAALPNEDECAACTLEIEAALAEVELT